MVNKKAYMRTLEAFAAILLTFVFMMYVIPQFQGNEVRRVNLDVMGRAMYDSEFRACAITEPRIDAVNCTEYAIDKYIPSTHNFKVEISKSRRFNGTNLPATRIFSESTIIVGNLTQYSPRYIRVYYWLR